MRYIPIISAVVAAAVLSGCSCLYAPSSSLIENTPVVKMGSTTNPPKEFILFIPANSKFPMNFLAKGDALDTNETATVMVSFTKDIYLYDHWASLDGKKWMDFHSMFKVKPSGGFDSMGANIQLKMDYAK